MRIAEQGSRLKPWDPQAALLQQLTSYNPSMSAIGSLPPVPLTVEGASVLHQMMRIRWSQWKGVPAERRATILDEASRALGDMEHNASGQTGMYSLLGHKGDLMLIHFRQSFEELNEVELRFSRLGLYDYLESTHSYLSIVELGLYESTGKVYSSLAERGIVPHSPGWETAVEEELERQRTAMRPRFIRISPHRSMHVFIPWIGAAANRKIGTSFRWPNESARCMNMG